MIFNFSLGGEKTMQFLTAQGQGIGFGESLAKSGIGFLIVFIGLICLIAIGTILGKICQAVLKDDAKAPAAKAAAPAPASAPTAKTIENRDELVVAFSAAVAEELGTDVSAIRVVSLKEIG